MALLLAPVSGIHNSVTTPLNASAQTVGDRIDAISAAMKRLRELSARMPATTGAKLSAGAQQLIYLSKRWDELAPELASSFGGAAAPLTAQAAPASAILLAGGVSDPRHDLTVSRVVGYTQSETSTAWCGHNVVVGYNDSGSFLETFPLPGVGLSFNGYSRSTNGGRTFTDLGYLNPGPPISSFLAGDPVVVCTDENTFYQSSIFSSSFFTTDVAVMKSTDGGKTFGNPVSAVSMDAFSHFIDKPWLAADPSNPKRLYVTFTDFDFSGTLCPSFGTNIDLVTSADGGSTWSAPQVIHSACFPDGDQGSNVAVSGNGNVHVAWERFPATTPTNEIDIRRSTDHAATFTTVVPVAIVTPVGSGLGSLQGGFRNNESPSLAVDPSHPERLFVTWNDGRFGVTPDFVLGHYNFGDVFVSRSDNGGLTWSAAAKVNDDPGAANHIDHFLPAVAVDGNGSVGICFYDRRRDPQNFLIDRECALSTDNGATWKNFRVTKKNSFAASIAGDLLVNPVYMGDYDGVAADATGQTNGLLGAYGDNRRGNPDVFISPRFGGEGDQNNDQN